MLGRGVSLWITAEIRPSFQFLLTLIVNWNFNASLWILKVGRVSAKRKIGSI